MKAKDPENSIREYLCNYRRWFACKPSLFFIYRIFSTSLEVGLVTLLHRDWPNVNHRCQHWIYFCSPPWQVWSLTKVFSFHVGGSISNSLIKLRALEVVLYGTPSTMTAIFTTLCSARKTERRSQAKTKYLTFHVRKFPFEFC